MGQGRRGQERAAQLGQWEAFGEDTPAHDSFLCRSGCSGTHPWRRFLNPESRLRGGGLELVRSAGQATLTAGTGKTGCRAESMHRTTQISLRHGDITAVILAGGRGRRMGGDDKGLIPLAGRPMIAHVVAALEGQAGELLVSANRNLDRYAALGCRVITDSVGDFAGPLAGMVSALQASRTRYVMTAPCDAPLVPDDLAVRLLAALSDADAEIAVAHDGDRIQPVFSLVRRDLTQSLLSYLAEGERKTSRWLARHTAVFADFSDKPETLVNVNTQAERTALETALQRGHAARQRGRSRVSGPCLKTHTSPSSVSPHTAARARRSC